MVLLAVRPYKHAHFNLGRETFLVPVLWDSDGWLRIDTEMDLLTLRNDVRICHMILESPNFIVITLNALS